MKDSRIAWCHNTINLWQGCSGTNCPLFLNYCYARGSVSRWGRDFSAVTRTSAHYWLQLLRWEAECASTGHAKRVFLGSLMDFNDEQADSIRPLVWSLIRRCPHLVFMVLTKNPQRFPRTLPRDWNPERYPNVWLGTSVLNDITFKRHVAYLLEVQAARHFLSCEPLWGSISSPRLEEIDLVLVGGMSGPKWKAHPMSMAWAVDLYQTCQRQGTAYFFKQISALRDEQGIDAIGKAIDGQPRIIRHMPSYVYPWAPMQEKGDRLEAA